MTSILKRAALGALLTTAIAGTPAVPAELLMFEEDWCEWCERWNEEIGPIYPKTAEGKRAPLVRIDIHGVYPDVELTSRPQFTPTFILIDKGREIGRIEGYPGEDFFWGLLERLMARLPETPETGG